MNEDKITPALNPKDALPNEMSAEEFQRRLYAWFEDRGLLSELRAHLRTQMIGVLKDTGVGRLVSASTISPKLQALNLLIAEFLLQQDYHYSLSVFSAEVPLTNVLPEIPNCSYANKISNTKKWQFTDKDMWDILETLGIQRYTEEAENIFNAYYNGTSSDSLLICIVRMLNSLQSKPVSNFEVHQGVDKGLQNWKKDVFKVLSGQNISTLSVNKILRILGDIIDAEQVRLRNESREQYIKLEHELQLHFENVVKEQDDRIAELQRSLDIELSKNQEMAKDYERQQVQHRDRLHKLVIREQNVSKRESQIKEKDAFIKAQEFLIKSKLNSLQQEQRSLTVLQDRLEYELHQSKLTAKSDVQLLKNLENECNNIKTQISDTKETINHKIQEDDTEQAAVQILITQLKHENDNLKAINADQQLHIRDLSQRAALLVHELEDAQNAFNSLQARGHGIITAPTLTSPVHHVRSVSGGAGEEVGVRHSQRLFRPTPSVTNTAEANRRRLVPRKLTVHSSSSSEDLSPTSELLKEARQRLRRLEQESEEIDRNYRLYQSTLSNNFQMYNASITGPSHAILPTTYCKSYNNTNLFNLSKGSKKNNEDKEESKEPKQSEGSSDVWDGAGTSGISFSAAPTSDEKSDSQQDDDDIA